MYQRFKEGLFSPSQIAKYQNDKKIVTVLFLFLLVLISITPSLINLNQNQGLDYENRTIIRQSFYDDEVPFAIVDSLLIAKNGSNITHSVSINSAFQIVFTDQESIETNFANLDTYSRIVLTKQYVYFQQSLINVKLFAYSDYPSLANLDFSDALVDDQAFWSTVFLVVEDQIAEYGSFTLVANILTLVIGEIFVLGLFGLIVAIFQMMSLSGYLKFGHVWQVMTYILVPYVVSKVFEELFSINYLSFIGAIITVFYANRLTQVILQRKD
ncbi:MAG: DUF1189 family protein [Bacilli bacterium]